MHVIHSIIRKKEGTRGRRKEEKKGNSTKKVGVKGKEEEEKRTLYEESRNKRKGKRTGTGEERELHRESGRERKGKGAGRGEEK